MAVAWRDYPSARGRASAPTWWARTRLWSAKAADLLAQPRWWLEVGIIWAVYSAYSRIRNVGGKDVDRAFDDGRAILQIEQDLHIDVESAVNRWVHSNGWVADLSALHYHTLHWWVTIGVFVWLFWRRRYGYRRASLVLAATTLIALAGFFLIPTAPPRMYPGYIDIMAQTSSWGWWEASGSPGPQSVTNEFAAMPSLHCGWAIWCGVMIVWYARRRWVRALGLLYPISTAFVVIGTANHYVLDIIAIAVVIVVAMAVVYLPRRQAAEALARRSAPAGRSAG